MKTAVIYARYSSERQTEQSIEGQLRECMAYAEQHDMMVVDTYIDRAMTGTNDNRNDFQRMLKDAQKKGGVTMSSWGTGIKQIDEFMDVYDEFFELYKDNAVAMDIYQTILKAWRCAPGRWRSSATPIIVKGYVYPLTKTMDRFRKNLRYGSIL